MQAILSQALQRTRALPATTISATHSATPSGPRLQSRTPRSAPFPMLQHQRAPYYFDASQQTAKTLRVLTQAVQRGHDSLGLRRDSELLSNAMTELLQSLTPRLPDDAASKTYFVALLRMHLLQLEPGELQALKQTLQDARFRCHISECVIADAAYEEFGFTNGPPHTQTRTLLQTDELFDLIDEMQAMRFIQAERTLPAPAAQAVRHQLADSAARWQASDRSPEMLISVAAALSQAIGLSGPPPTMLTSAPLPPGSLLRREGAALILMPELDEALAQDRDGQVFATVLRDLTELLLAKALCDSDLLPHRLPAVQRRSLAKGLEQIYAAVPEEDSHCVARAKAVSARSAAFGTVQILPTVGAALGHAWIAPTLSVIPDRHVRSTDIGQRYMHGGNLLEAQPVTIREWPMRYLSVRENEDLYPALEAWQLKVPVDAARLQLAATDVRREWTERSVPYRFNGTEPRMKRTGGRQVVWEGVQRAMDEEASALFTYFNRGLADPDSPTELWQRLDGFSRWIDTLARR